MYSSKDFASFFGRLLICAIFLMSGCKKIISFEATIQYMMAKGMPFVQLMCILAIISEIVGGLFILLGYRTRLGACILIIFLALATYIFHDFWNLEGGERQLQMIMFMKNLAIFGGLLLLLGHGSGRLSIDREMPKRY